MAVDPRHDVVASQYERWVYPEPIADLPGWLATNWQWFDPSHAHRIFWPDRAYRPDMRILVAGCGTNQAAVIAYTNPSATVVGIDVSESSLAHQHHLQERYGLENLRLQRMPIEEAGQLGDDFDLIISTGVLHHLDDPQTGMNALAEVLRPDGVIAIMLYARYGRIGVELMQALFRDLGLGQDERSLAMVKDVIASLPDEHPVRDYLAIAPDLTFDAGLVDTFLHGRDRSFTVEDCLNLVTSAGLVFQEWFLKSPYEPSVSSNPASAAIALLPDAQRWSVMERINTRNACHFFTACRPERPTSSYRVDPQSLQAVRDIPLMRLRCGLDGDDLVRPGWRLRLDPVERAIVAQIDGHRTIDDIVVAARAVAGPGVDQTMVQSLLSALWNRDFIAFARINSQ